MMMAIVCLWVLHMDLNKDQITSLILGHFVGALVLSFSLFWNTLSRFWNTFSYFWNTFSRVTRRTKVKLSEFMLFNHFRTGPCCTNSGSIEIVTIFYFSHCSWLFWGQKFLRVFWIASNGSFLDWNFHLSSWHQNGKISHREFHTCCSNWKHWYSGLWVWWR